MESVSWQELTTGLYQLIGKTKNQGDYRWRYRSVFVSSGGGDSDDPGPPWVVSATSAGHDESPVTVYGEYPTLDEAQLVGVAMYRMGLFNPPQE